jgi:hypothetical protein
MSFDILGYRLGAFEVFALLKRCAALLVVCYRRFGPIFKSKAVREESLSWPSN